MTDERPPENGPFVSITKREIYDAVMRLNANVAELNKTVKDIMGQDGLIHDLKKRTRRLELKVFGLMSGVVTALTMVGFTLIRGVV